MVSFFGEVNRMSLFCREIMLYNEFVPALEPEKHNWEYRAYGHYDGIGIGKKIEFQNGSSFEKIYTSCAESDSENMSYATQTLLGFFENEEKEHEFWQTDKPFLYIVLLQVADNASTPFYKDMCDGKFLKNQYKEIGLNEKQWESIMVQPYYSLDNSDFFLAVKCDYTSIGTKYINYLHQKKEENTFQVKNSYSILGVQSAMIENGLPDDISNEKIDMIELRAIEKEGGSIGQLYKKLREEFEADKSIKVSRLSLLGTEDEAIVITNISWRKLLPLYSKQNGLLSNSCANYTSAISTKVMFHINDNNAAVIKNMENNGDVNETKICDKMCKLINEIYKDCNDVRKISEKKNLMMLVNSLRRFEKKNQLFADYNFFTLFMPLYVFLRLLKKGNDGNTIFYYEFMKSMRLRTQNFTKSDRVFSQVVDFNMRYFDVPTKFITLYSAYIYRFKKMLNLKNAKKYEFLICPGENGQMEVKEIMPRVSNEERLFLVGVPESQMYAPKLMCIMLGHEIAHFVGTRIRCRESRAKSLAKMCARMIVLSMQAYLANESDADILWENTGKAWENCEQKLVQWLDFYITRIQDENYLKEYYYSKECYNEKNLKFNKEYYCHTNMLKDTLSMSIAEFLQERGKNTFGFAIQNMYANNTDEKINKQQYFEQMGEKSQECINDFVAPVKKGNDILNMHGGIDQFIYLVKECYADMICILALHLSLADYLQAFISNLGEMGKHADEMADTMLIARIAIVMCVVRYPRDNELEKYSNINEKEQQIIWGWGDDELEKIEEESECCELEELATEFSEHYIANTYKMDLKALINNVVDIIYDQKILKEIIRYLLKCRAEYYREMLQVHNKKNMAEIMQFYRTVQMDDTEKMFSEIGKIISQYEKDIRVEMGEM